MWYAWYATVRPKIKNKAITKVIQNFSSTFTLKSSSQLKDFCATFPRFVTCSGLAGCCPGVPGKPENAAVSSPTSTLPGSSTGGRSQPALSTSARSSQKGLTPKLPLCSFLILNYYILLQSLLKCLIHFRKFSSVP